MKVLVLIDGLHANETIDSLARLVDLKSADLMLAYVTGRAPRAGLDLVTQRPGSRPIPPHRERELHEAEAAAGDEAIAEAEEIARRHAPRVESIRLSGDPGRAVCEVASERGAHLVVVRAGGWDRPPIGPASLGPAARFIADHCRVPVLLLRS